ncbi:hypothetical protein V6N13_128430 [Hibiscus sabdariffa]
MSLYSTIWDGSNWATEGGRYKVNYRYAPFTADYSDFVIDGSGCSKDNIGSCMHGITNMVSNFTGLVPDKMKQMKLYRNKYMYYSYCDDRHRYPVPFPECSEPDA